MRKIQIKTIVRYLYTSAKVSKFTKKKAQNSEHLLGAMMWNSHQLELSILLLGMQNVKTILEDSLTFSYRIKYTLIIRLSNPITRYLQKRNKNLSLCKELPMKFFLMAH